MPLNTTQTIQLEITRVDIQVSDQVIVVYFKTGYTDAAGTYVQLNADNRTIPTNEVQTLFALTSPDTTTTLYQTLKVSLYNWLISQGIATGVIV